MKLDKLRAMSDAEVEAAYDKAAEHTSVGLGFWEDELERRSRQRLVESNQRLSKWSLVISIVSGVASIAAVGLAVVTLLTTG